MSRARFLLVVAVLAATALAGAPASAAPPELPRAKAAIAIDARDGDPLYQKNPDAERPIASATKLMTALLALERTRPSQVFPGADYGAGAAESKINLRAGERMNVRDLLEALLLESANDAAVTLAEGISGSRPAFVRAMNERASQLGLGDTSYANPIGFDDPNNGSTARELAALARRLMQNPRFARIVDMPSAVLESGARRRVVRNRNRLVGQHRFVDGVKTGHTLGAGYLLVGAAHKKGGARVITVVMGEPGEAARDAETLELMRYSLGLFRPRRALTRGRPVTRVKVEHRDERVGLAPARGVTVTARRGQRVERRLRAPAELEGPLPRGRRVGSVTVLRDGRPLRTVPLVTASSVPGAGPLRVFLSGVGLPLTLLVLAAMLTAVALLASRRKLRIRLTR